MSLLFLRSILEGFQALDDAGAPIPGATLTFWRAGTTRKAPVYADQALETEHDNPLTADELGRFPLIYLSPDIKAYRVLLHTGPPPFELRPDPNPRRRTWGPAGGVLRWDIDPYLCDCTEPPLIFRGPIHRAISDEGRPLAGARLTFTLTESETPTNVYADAALKVPLPNPLQADAGGFFPPVYLDDDTEYRVRLKTAAGAELLDIDPYVCQCGSLFLTSKMYAVEFRDAARATAGEAVRGRYYPVFGPDSAAGEGGRVNGGTMINPIRPYDDWPPDEATGAGGEINFGTMVLPIVSYDDWPPDAAVGDGGEIDSGTMIAPVVVYDDWPADAAVGEGGEINSGTMTTP